MIRRTIKEFNECTVDPTLFLRAQPELEERLRIQLKTAYDLTKKLEDCHNRHNSTLPKLITSNFDIEQIWQQVEIQNKFAYSELQKCLSLYLKKAKKNVDSDADEEQPQSEESDIECTNEDDLQSKSIESEDEVQKKVVRFDLEDKSDSVSGGRLQQLIGKLEKSALGDKPWQMKGEVSAKTRPENSLLEEYLEFDVTTRPAPVITEDAALKLEDVILKRIKDKVWDDVERKIKPVDTPYEFKKKLVLDQEKSKASLAQIYEQEYLKQKEATDSANKFIDAEEPKEYKQIRGLLDSLFRKLDSLSNYHYTPIPAAPELQIVNNLPAVSLEEAIPAAVSDAVLLAPEEIQPKKRGELQSKEERTCTDKKRFRRKKKLRQKLRKKTVGDKKQPKKVKRNNKMKS